jgi:succinate dehydrogenase/fumarate reductase cytochrome b subunit
MNSLLRVLAQYEIDLKTLPHGSAGQSNIQAILTIVFSITGALAVLFIVVGGMRYITAQGDPQQISKAKNTLIYAIVGLLVSISAVAIVTFVLGRVGA